MTYDRDQAHAVADTSRGDADRDAVPGRNAHTAHLLARPHAIASGLIQRKARDANGVAPDAETALAATASSSGAPLPTTLMRKFEASLGADLSGVRVHDGAASATAAHAVGAKAYTLGQDIHFGAGHYDPSSSAGEHLLAHEVAHTVQQAGGIGRRVQYQLEVSSPGDAHEVEADRAADAMVRGAAHTAGTATAPTFARKLDAPGANVTAQGELGDQSITVGTNEKGRMVAGAERKLFSKEHAEPFGPGFYWSLEFSVSFVSEVEAPESGPAKSEDTGTKGKIVVQGSGSIGMGGAKNESKLGLEGQVAISGNCEAALGRDSMIEGNPAITLVAQVNLRLVAEASEKLKGNISKQLSQLVIFRGILTGNSIEGTWCGKDDIVKAGQDLLDNSAGVGLLGAPGIGYEMYKQHEEDVAGQHEFDDNLKKEQDQQMSTGDPSPQLANRLGGTSQAYAEPETDVHEQYDRKIEDYATIAERSKAPFNRAEAQDQTWWKNGAYAVFNDGTVHMMTANQIKAQYKAAHGNAAVKPLAEKAIAEYNEAHNRFLDAQRHQFGDVQTG